VTGPHLGQVAAALADGQLRGEALDRALGHVSACAACRAEVVQHRAVKRLIAGPATPPEPPAALAARLRALQPPLGAGPALCLEGRPRAPVRHVIGVPSRSLLAGALALAALGGGATLAVRGDRAPLPMGGGSRIVDPASVAGLPGQPPRGVVMDDPVVPVVAVVAVP